MATPAAAPRPSAPAPRRSRLARLGRLVSLVGLVDLARGLPGRPSVLRRRTDTWRSVLLELRILGVLAALAVGALVGMSVYQQGRAHALEQARNLRPVQARIVSRPSPTGDGGDVAQVTWTASDGTVQQAVTGVPAADGVGDHVGIWLDASGQPVAAPTSVVNIAGTAVLVGLLVTVGAGVVVESAGALARWHLDRRDEETWETEWQVVEPVWSRRR
ncbi:Rv1733c family protein [Streptacidiphilus fuscans]|uniref:Transmembrane protein n=1 Tax=Streptacidiphilus fuscans TaxID=2789292 RepID=A0A931B2Y8_9ACTN|nr:hypothetical protein [Streptacidiphilus fuscans]MBF9067028.1 hypothetical protein [Streptacidiphilus fuscans]